MEKFSVIVTIPVGQEGNTLSLNLTEKTVINEVSNRDAVRYLKGIFTNLERFKSRLTDVCRTVYKKEDIPAEMVGTFKHDEFMNELEELFEQVKPFNYDEAFKIENRDFQAKVFGSINVGEMIQNLGANRIATDGIEVKHKRFDTDGNLLGVEDYHNVYEVYEVSGEKLGLQENIYALKCWCTSTNLEHWLWIEDQYKDKPLEAVASTFRIHKNLIPHIKELKRQGDVLLVEMKEDVVPEGEIVALTAEQYFGLLTSQS
jgi:hypothetical protein